MQQYGRNVVYPILGAYTTTAGNTAGPRVVSLWRVPNVDSYVRLANADHEAWPINTDTTTDNGISEPYRFIIAGVDTAPADFPKAWYFPQGSYYKTSYAVSWWNKDYGSSSRRGFIRFRPVVVPEFVGSDFDPADRPTSPAQTRGFGLVQYFGRKIDGNALQPLYGVGIVVMASIPENLFDFQRVTFRKYLVFFVGDRCIWHYEFANPEQIAHATKVDGVWTAAFANWISMRAGPNANTQSNQPINIGVFTYSTDDNIAQNARTDLPGALSGVGHINMSGTKIDLYTEHMVARVHIDLDGENQTPSGGATQDDRTGTGNRQWFVPSITTNWEPPDSTWLGWYYWRFHTWLLGVQSPLREFTMSIPLNVSNPPSTPYQVRVRTFHQVDRPLSAPSHFTAFRGTNDGTRFPDSPENATVYTPVAAPHPYNCCGWYRPWDNATSTEPQHRYWWVDHKIIHGVI